jgi:hypothetical protein
MAHLPARVRDGHIVVDEATELPEGTKLTVMLLDSDDEMTAAERADLDVEIERGRADIVAGRGLSAEDLLSRIRSA